MTGVSFPRRFRSGGAFVLLCCLATLLAAHGSPGAGPSEDYDILVRNGRVVDGSGNPWFHGDVAIRGGKIAAIGDLADASASKVIDAAGLYVAPGFIDTHNHSDRGLRNPDLRYTKFWLVQGVTTVILGVDGWGDPQEPVEARSWGKAGMSVNTAFYVGHNTVRRQVIGIEKRAPSPAELEKMKSLVRQGMENGALGLSSGLVYVPGTYSNTQEVVELAKVVAEYGGIYDTHHRDEMTHFMDSLREAIEISRRASVPLHIAHIKVMGQDNWGQMAVAVAVINQARASGQEITANQYCFPNGAVRTSLASVLQVPSGLGTLSTMFHALHGNPADFENDQQQTRYVQELVKALDDPAKREKIRRANDDGMEEPGANNYLKKWGYGWLRVEVSQKNPQYVGMTVPQIAQKENLDPFGVAEKLIRTEDQHFVVSIGPVLESDVVTVLKQPWLMFSSDGELTSLGPRWINPRSLGSFARPYRKYAREEKVITLEDAVRKMTGLAAQTLRLRDRGYLREGMAADVVIFDGNRMADKSTYADSLHYPEGVVDVIVNGVLSFENGGLTGKPAGQVLSRKASAHGD